MRISSLPKEQRVNIKLSVSSNLIIKILKDGILLSDCLQYDHYVTWYENVYRIKVEEERPVNLELPAGKWAIAS